MKPSTPPLTGMEKYVVALMYVIGGLFFILQVVSLISTKSRIFSSAEGVISINRNEMLSLLRVLTLIILCISGAVLFTKRKSTGWSINLAVLIFFSLLLGSMLYANYNTFDLTIGIAGCTIILLTVGVFFLLLRKTRIRYNVTRNSILIAIALLIFLGVFYIYLQ